MNRIEILHFTDPLCGWCWGSEPVLKKISESYGDNVEIRKVMGGMVGDIRMNFPDELAEEFDSINAAVSGMWKTASSRHGMPVAEEGFHLFSEENLDSFSQNISVKAAQMQGEIRATDYYRRLMEATMVENRDTSKLSVQIEIADEAGLNTGAFIMAMKDGSAEKAFKEDAKLLYKYQVNSFPTFLVRYEDKEVVMRGFHIFEDFKKVVDEYLDASEIVPIEYVGTLGEIEDFICKYPSTAPREIETVFPLGSLEVDWTIDKLVEEGKIEKYSAGTGYLVKEADREKVYEDIFK